MIVYFLALYYWLRASKCRPMPVGAVLMKRELMDILACPVCKGPLQLKVEKEEQDEIVSGGLYCQKCNEVYPIVDTIPNLLPRELRS
jgi:uncharacterized protein YbaR (Trm112 family)